MPNYTFHTSHDAAAIKDCVLQPWNVRYQFKNGEDPETWEPPFNDKTMYIAVYCGKTLEGFFILLRKDTHIAEAHMVFYKLAWGHVCEMGWQCLRWIWTNFPFLNMLLAPIAVGNKLAEKCAIKMGFRNTGMINDGYQCFTVSKL